LGNLWIWDGSIVEEEVGRQAGTKVLHIRGNRGGWKAGMGWGMCMASGRIRILNLNRLKN